jgi:Uma2 family endonuclease
MTKGDALLEKIVDSAPQQTKSHLRSQGSWTYEDWLYFPNDGWKYEIIDGVLYMTPPPTTPHQRSSIGLAARMYIYAMENDLGEVLAAPCGVRLPNQPVPFEPDIFFIKKENLHVITEKEVTGVPDLIVEILSPSNANYDREQKFKIYQEAGVPEYWLVNYWDKTVEVFVLAEGTYMLLGKYEAGQTIVSEQLIGFEISVNTIFKF